jgi:flagellar hook-associated protein 3 FlgL
MRISTRQIYTQGVEAFQQQQQKLAKLQQQISTGVRLTKPSDDPAAAYKPFH